MSDNKLSPREIQTQVNQLLKQSVGYLGDELSSQRADLMSAYLGEPYGDEEADRSQVISTDVADTIDSILPSMMRVLLSGEHPAKFNPSGPDDEELASQETEAVSHVLMNQNNGFVTLSSACLDALIQKNCISKISWESKDVTKVEEYGNLTSEKLVELLQNLEQKYESVEVLEYEQNVTMEKQEIMDPQSGQPVMVEMPIELFSVKLKLIGKDEKCRVDPIPPDSFLVSPRHNSIYLDEAPFVAHRDLFSMSSLIQMGFDRDQLETLTKGSDYELGEERLVRFEQEGEYESNEFHSAARGMEEIVVSECYVWIDIDGDGIAELNKIFIAGGSDGVILKWDGS
jgi:hypothetical protein